MGCSITGIDAALLESGVPFLEAGERFGDGETGACAVNLGGVALGVVLSVSREGLEGVVSPGGVPLGLEVVPIWRVDDFEGVVTCMKGESSFTTGLADMEAIRIRSGVVVVAVECSLGMAGRGLALRGRARGDTIDTAVLRCKDGLARLVEELFDFWTSVRLVDATDTGGLTFGTDGPVIAAPLGSGEGLLWTLLLGVLVELDDGNFWGNAEGGIEERREASRLNLLVEKDGMADVETRFPLTSLVLLPFADVSLAGIEPLRQKRSALAQILNNEG